MHEQKEKQQHNNNNRGDLVTKEHQIRFKCKAPNIFKALCI